MKKILVISICILMLASTMFVGCGENNSQNSKENNNGATLSNENNNDKDNKASDKNDSNSNDEVSSVMSAAGELPIVKPGNDVKLTIATYTHNLVDDYDDNEFTKYLEEKTGIDLVFNVMPSNEKKQKVNLMIASGDYPDVFCVKGIFTLAEMQIYADQGVIIPLDNMIEEYGVYTKEAWAQYPDYDIKKLYSLLDGQIYTFPHLTECYHCQVSNKMWIYKPWLDALSLEMPNTTEEFEAVLKAFAQNDPNQNGKIDEVALSGIAGNKNTGIDSFLMSAFVRNDGDKRIFIENNKVTVAYDKPEWKEGLTWINHLYENEYISAECFTQDVSQLKLIGNNKDEVILGMFPGTSIADGMQIGGDSERWLDYVAIPPLEGPNGVREVPLKRPLGKESAFEITSACEYPEIAFRLGDLLYSEEFGRMGKFGRQGIEWDYAKEGELGINGEQGSVKQMVSFQDMEKNIVWKNFHLVEPSSFRLGRIIDNPIERILYEESKEKYFPYAESMDTTVPELIFNEDDAAELVDIETTLVDYVNEMTTRFIVGDIGIDEGWDAYTRELKNIGIERYLELYQNAYDLKMK